MRISDHSMSEYHIILILSGPDDIRALPPYRPYGYSSRLPIYIPLQTITSRKRHCQVSIYHLRQSEG